MSTNRGRARHAVTRITWAEHFPGVALIGVAIATGRTHQIRVHFSWIGHPVVGDAMYGGVRRRVVPQLRAVQNRIGPSCTPPGSPSNIRAIPARSNSWRSCLTI